MSKTLLVGFVALVLAGLSWLAEVTFYGGVSPEGVLQESFFLPLTFILGAVGLVLVVVGFVRRGRA